MLEKLKEKLKGATTWIIFMIILAIVFIPYIIIFLNYRKQGKSVTLYPKFEVKEIKNTADINKETLNGAITTANNILEKIKSNL